MQRSRGKCVPPASRRTAAVSNRDTHVPALREPRHEPHRCARPGRRHRRRAHVHRALRRHADPHRPRARQRSRPAASGDRRAPRRDRDRRARRSPSQPRLAARELRRRRARQARARGEADGRIDDRPSARTKSPSGSACAIGATSGIAWSRRWRSASSRENWNRRPGIGESQPLVPAAPIGDHPASSAGSGRKLHCDAAHEMFASRSGARDDSVRGGASIAGARGFPALSEGRRVRGAAVRACPRRGAARGFPVAEPKAPLAKSGRRELVGL